MQKFAPVLSFFITTFIVFATPLTGMAAPITALNGQDIATLTKPSVVLIDNRVDEKFDTEIPEINLGTLTVKSVLLAGQTAEPFNLEANIIDQTGLRSFDFSGENSEEATGSGFIINSSGDIMTNAHVASSHTFENELYDEIAQELMSEVGQESPQDAATFTALSESQQTDFESKIVSFLISHTTVTENNNQLTVINPSIAGKTLDDGVHAGFPATLVKVNENYPIDGKDFAIIKIDATNLPSLPIRMNETATSGSDVYIFGFPANATISGTDYTDATFTRGVIGAVKNNGPYNLPIYQTDAKISSGSSGSPMIDANGNVIGIITYSSGGDPFSGSSGDSFGYGIPINLAADFLKDAGVQNNTGVYYTTALAGITDLHAGSCKTALKEFGKLSDVNNVNTNFVMQSDIAAYTGTCTAGSGGFFSGLFSDMTIFLLSLCIILLVVLVVVNFLFDQRTLHRLEKDEVKIDELEKKEREYTVSQPPFPPKV